MAGLVVHEWVSRVGGSEKVLDALADAFPAAEIGCLWNDATDLRYPGRRVTESWLSRTPLRRSKAAALPFMLPTWRSWRAAGPPDWVLASSHLFAHHVRVAGAPDVPKLAYVYTPARYVWTPELDARGAGAGPRAVAPAIRAIDRRRAAEPAAVAGISRYVADRIATTWGRDAEVIYPPVETERLQAVPQWAHLLDAGQRALLDSLPRPFLLGASRFVPYKRLDLVVDAGAATGLPVVLAGAGPDEARLRAHAERSGVPVTFVLRPPDRLLYALYQAALVFVFPPVEDFGIMPVEAMALGTPVVTCAVGGGSETVVDGRTGALVPPGAGREELAAAVRRAAGADPEACRARAREFGAHRFRAEVTAWVERSTGVPAGAR